ncbi:MAG: citrate transporter, partial [Coprococcus sp.]
GAVTFLIAIPAMLPLYEKLGMRKTTLATLVALGAGVMNMLPWGGPTIRAITAMSSNIEELFTPMVIPMICGLAF